MFRAHEPARDRLVAIKVFRLDITPEHVAALVGHLQQLIAADIRHPNIAAPIATGVQDGEAYLAQEHAVGDSLDVVLRARGPLSIHEALPLVESLTAAIDYARSRGLHHGSLHPRDIILSADGACITGFGIAAALSRVGAKLPTRPQYAAPDGSSDAYSLGAIAFEMVTGKRVTPANLEEFKTTHRVDLRGAIGAALAALTAPTFAPSEPIASVGKPDAPNAPNAPVAPVAPNAPVAPPAPAFALDELIASALDEVGAARGTREPGKPDLDLRFDQPVEWMAEREDDPADRIIVPSAAPVLASWSAQPRRALDPIEDLAEPRSRRWPIVAVLLVFGIVAALSVGFFLKSPTPLPTRDPKTGVDETTVDLPSPSPAPVPKSPPAPMPSRSASGAIARTQEPARGSLLIRSTPADADVLLNGGARGKTPLAVRDLALGSYTIRVARDGYVPEERTLQLSAQRPTAATTFDLRPTSAPTGATVGKPGGITVLSRPAGARVFVNDSLVGSTPFALPSFRAGSATVRIEMDGYETWTTTVRVAAGEQTRVAASLERNQQQ